MKNIIQFTISKGEKYYVASGVDFPIVTQAKSLDALQKNVIEAIELHFSGKKASSLGVSKKPSVLINYELPTELCLA